MPISEANHFESSFLGPNPGELDARICQRKLAYRDFDIRFNRRPICAKADGAGAATGTTGDVNLLMVDGGRILEYHIKGTQTLVAPVIGSNGLNVSLDLTDNDGIELTPGITALSPFAYVVGTDLAFFTSLRFRLTDVSGTDQCMVGFRKAEAYRADWNDYDELFAVNIVSGDIKTSKILNNAATSTTDTTDDWADATQKEVSIYVSAGGVCTVKVNTGTGPTGQAPTVELAHTFDAGEVVVPFFYMLHDADVAEATELIRWRAGFQA